MEAAAQDQAETIRSKRINDASTVDVAIASTSGTARSKENRIEQQQQQQQQEQQGSDGFLNDTCSLCNYLASIKAMANEHDKAGGSGVGAGNSSSPVGKAEREPVERARVKCKCSESVQVERGKEKVSKKHQEKELKQQQQQLKAVSTRKATGKLVAPNKTDKQQHKSDSGSGASSSSKRNKQEAQPVSSGTTKGLPPIGSKPLPLGKTMAIEQSLPSGPIDENATAARSDTRAEVAPIDLDESKIADHLRQDEQQQQRQEMFEVTPKRVPMTRFSRGFSLDNNSSGSRKESVEDEMNNALSGNISSSNCSKNIDDNSNSDNRKCTNSLAKTSAAARGRAGTLKRGNQIKLASQSSGSLLNRLIVINSKNVSYTIKVTPRDSSGLNQSQAGETVTTTTTTTTTTKTTANKNSATIENSEEHKAITHCGGRAESNPQQQQHHEIDSESAGPERQSPTGPAAASAASEIVLSSGKLNLEASGGTKSGRHHQSEPALENIKPGDNPLEDSLSSHKRPLNRIDLCKKFLVDNIATSSLRSLIGRGGRAAKRRHKSTNKRSRSSSKRLSSTSIERSGQPTESALNSTKTKSRIKTFEDFDKNYAHASKQQLERQYKDIKAGPKERSASEYYKQLLKTASSSASSSPSTSTTTAIATRATIATQATKSKQEEYSKKASPEGNGKSRRRFKGQEATADRGKKSLTLRQSFSSSSARSFLSTASTSIVHLGRRFNRSAAPTTRATSTTLSGGGGSSKKVSAGSSSGESLDRKNQRSKSKMDAAAAAAPEPGEAPIDRDGDIGITALDAAASTSAGLGAGAIDLRCPTGSDAKQVGCQIRLSTDWDEDETELVGEAACSGIDGDQDGGQQLATVAAMSRDKRHRNRKSDETEAMAPGKLQQPQQHQHHHQQQIDTMDEASKSCGIAAKRLRELTAHLEHGSVPRSVLYETLEYAASVLDSITMDQISRVSDEEDGDLSEVQSDAVPTEVRKWLETTFTRNSISQKRRTDDKLKFRSVANAIRAGIVVDRIYRRMSASTPFVSQEVSQLLKSIDDWSFNCFQINQVSSGQVLKSVGYELFNRYGLMYKFKIPTTTLKNFLTQIESGYTKHKNPYHNNLHAADVTQTVHYMLWQAGLTNWLTDLEIFATLLAAIIHDYLHTGTTNNFHVMSQSETALIYNDRAVLENFHISQAFQLMKNEDCNILAGLSKDEYRGFRSLVIDMVLATDMSSHFQQIKAMKNILNHADNFNADKSKILSLVIHISDISHPAKDWELHSQWTNLLMEEFFRQGDREKELDLECSPLCDRETTLVAESQLGFIEFIVSPSLEICGDVLDRVHYQMAEANTRPVLPASAKAVSVFAAASTAVAAKITGPPPVANKSAEPNSGPEASSPVPPETPTTSRPTSVAATISTSTTSQDKNSSRNSSTLASSARNSTSDHNNHQQQQDTVTASNSSGSGNRQTVTTTSGSGVSIRSQQQQPKQQQQQQQQPLPRLPNRQLSGSSIDNASQSTASARTSVQHQSSVASSASSFASSFVSSDTIASNLRKMIASSSASISRKLNITTGSIGSMSAASSNSTNSLPMSPTATTTGASPPPPLPPPPTTTIVSTSGIVGNERRESASEQKTETVAEFEARQANYRHPVIQCNPSSPIQSRPKSSMVNRSAQMGTAAESNQQQQQQQLQSQRLQANSGDTSRSQPGSSLIAVTATEPKSSSDSLVAVNTNEQGLEMKWSAGIATRSAPPLQYFKIQRPWVACLERNKKMWRERSLLEGKKG